MIERRIFKQGNSFAITIPGIMLDQLGVAVGDYLLLESYPQQMIMLKSLEREQPSRHYELKDRMKQRGGKKQ